MRLILVPHTHWDREWYEPFAVFQQQLLEMFDSLLEIMAQEPRFRHFHLDGQSAMVDDYLAVRPEREYELRELFQSGRLSIGPWFTQMDEFLTSGESTIRNLEWGLERARSMGVTTPVGGPWAAYLPDQFGHIGQMPQLLRRAGIERAVVLRGVPAAIERGTFWWRAPDGSEVLAEYLMHGYYLGADLDKHMQSAATMAAELGRVAAIAGSIADRDIVLVEVGSDHTAPVPKMAQLVEEAVALTDLDAGFGSIAEFMAAAEPPASAPVWTGELRAASHWPLLPNVYATRPAQKRRRARLEARVERYAEPLAALVEGGAWPAGALEEVWRQLLWNGAHDSAYGCVHDQVARDVDDRFELAEDLVEGMIAEAMAHLATHAADAGTLRWNPSPFEREGVPGLGWVVVPTGTRAHATARAVDLRVDDGRIVLPDGTAITLTDEDDIGDLYTFCPPPDGTPTRPAGIEVTGPGRVMVHFSGSSVELRIEQGVDEAFVRVDGRIDNDRPDHRLRLWVGLTAAPEGSTALVPFELVDRPLVGEGYADETRSRTWPARGAVLASDTALLAEGVIECEIDGDQLGVSLLRAIGIIAQPTLATRPTWAGPGTATPEAQCLGETTFALGIWQGARRERLAEAWERFALPILEARVPGGGSETDGRLLTMEGGQLSGVRRLDDVVEARVWNDASHRVTARINGRSVELGAAAIETVRLDRDGDR